MNKSHNNKGGSIASNGYKLIYVGKEHHLADVRGYAYEHRLVAEIKYGRRLLPKEQVHHKDHDKLNNAPDNLEITKSMKYHRFIHRGKESNLKLPDEENIVIKCLCGCGEAFNKYDDCGRPRVYISGHNPAKSVLQDKILSLIDTPITLCELEEKINIPRKSFKSTLSILISSGKISRIGHGIYAKKGTPILKNNIKIRCLCGCGEEFFKYDSSGRERVFISGHNMKVKNNGKQ